LVTVCVVLFDIAAVAVNCEESPGLAEDAGAITVMDVTVGDTGVLGVVGVPVPPPHRTTPNAIATATSAARVRATEPPLYTSKAYCVRSNGLSRWLG
jgi:hypothetical protein